MTKPLFCALLLSFGCDGPAAQTPAAARFASSAAPAASPTRFSPYAFNRAAATYTLPPELAEISGVSLAGPDRLAGVEDESGTLYFYNLRTQQMDSTVKFGPKGDYEDLARQGDAWLILRSDGTIFRRTATQTTLHDTGLTAANEPEGLAYDAASGQLLVACKSEAGAGLDETKRAVYRLNPQTYRIEPKPAYVLDVPAILAADPGQQQGKKAPKVSQFAPSAVAIQSGTGHVFVLSARGNGLVELDKQGKVVAVQTLPGKLFPQPEGLAFARNGDLFISSEAGKKDGQGLVYRFTATAALN
ncbi:DNA-binding beta-propeller fold protein YncE [Hymenobacter luteus]|uniref:DNA-binding beta-propeller fold protein YncE n=2 Tax=Hymenobacter TaxID=89966 RepID=A0A7W9T424_9BACT|nr:MULTISPECIES: SdiA-regulated domain-containing protein [Hymenobacter]MBB4603429.1 DNA-binding beta-propeller fold protein YncE [Hymenobacter latericoloratus]MBB6061217.1 DNA-binding beta-propeller fold protein YncE [Hymenobacter luteus]